jgi:hypothetical protein
VLLAGNPDWPYTDACLGLPGDMAALMNKVSEAK